MEAYSVSQFEVGTAQAQMGFCSRSDDLEPLRAGDVLVWFGSDFGSEQAAMYLVLRVDEFVPRAQPQPTAPRLLNLETGESFLWYGELGGYMQRLYTGSTS